MPRKIDNAIRVRGRAGLRAHLALQHSGPGCPPDLGSQLDLRGLWSKTMYARSHALDEVAWRWKCSLCGARTIVVVE